MSIWRFIESLPSDIFTQMELDRKLFEEFVQDSEALPLFRIYRVSKPAITIGRSYQGRAFWWKTRKVCVRPTGGGLVRHGSDLLYSIIARRYCFSTFHQVRTSYLSFHEVIQDAFQGLGIETRLFRCDEAKKRKRAKDCFNEPVATDLLLDEKKVAGGAQWRRGESFLHQGSILIPRGVSYEGLKQAFLEAFERKFGVAWDKMKMVEVA